MRIYLVRHAEAVDRSADLADELRHLTAKGRKQAGKQGRRLRKHKLKPELIITSPLVRALQTAELLAAELGHATLVTAHASLAPGAPATAVIELLRTTGKLKRLMLVGHEPQLSQAAELVLGRKQLPTLRKASCLAVTWKPEQADQAARFEWYAISGKKLITTQRAFSSRTV